MMNKKVIQHKEPENQHEQQEIRKKMVITVIIITVMLLLVLLPLLLLVIDIRKFMRTDLRLDWRGSSFCPARLPSGRKAKPCERESEIQ
jgi:uncharacterized membrane protein (DUF485 family)